MKTLVPAGYMLAPSNSTYLTVALCSGVNMPPVTIQVPVTHETSGKDGSTTDIKDACPYSLLGHVGLPAVDPVLLAAAIAFVMALAFLPAGNNLPPLSPHLRPPLRGPPATA